MISTMVDRRYLEDECQPSLKDLKRHLRITSGDLDEILSPYLYAAINMAEHHIGKIIARSEFTYTGRFIRSFDMKGPEEKISGIEIDGKVLEESDYRLDKRTIIFNPEIKGEVVVIKYTSGMSQVPFDIQAAVMLSAARLFNNPVDSADTLPSVSKNLLRPYRTWGLDDGE